MAVENGPVEIVDLPIKNGVFCMFTRPGTINIHKQIFINPISSLYINPINYWFVVINPINIHKPIK